MRLPLRIFFLAVLLMGGYTSQAQDTRREELEEKKVRLMDEIALANRILSETQKDRRASLGNIETVQQKIKLRENLIRTLDREMEMVEEEQRQVKRGIDSLEQQIEEQREAYAEMIRQAYKSRSKISRLMFLLSSEDFNQAMRRLEYLKQYSEYRKQQVENIRRDQQQLDRKKESLQAQLLRKESLRDQLRAEKQRLSDEKLSQEEAIAEYKSMEEDLVQKLKKTQAEARRVEKEIQRIIASEIKRAKEAAERQSLEEEARSLGMERGRDFSSATSLERLRKSIRERREARAAESESPAPEPEKEESYSLTPEAKQLAANFAANRKRLPWPVERGLVVSKFGPQRHPVVKSVVIDNKGIDIAAERQTDVRSVFSGTISRVILLPDGYRAIIINHGQYFSVYQNLTNIKVTQGQKVEKGDLLGKVAENALNNETRLHFEIWKDDQVMDPLGWLAAKS